MRRSTQLIQSMLWLIAQSLPLSSGQKKILHLKNYQLWLPKPRPTTHEKLSPLAQVVLRPPAREELWSTRKKKLEISQDMWDTWGQESIQIQLKESVPNCYYQQTQSAHEAANLEGRPKAERKPTVNDTTEIEDRAELDDEEYDSTNPSLRIPTSLEEALEEADWYTYVLEKLPIFLFKDNHWKWINQQCFLRQ